MFIIVEGPDGAGKTTLIEQLKEGMPAVKVLHFGAPATPEEADNYYKVYLAALTDPSNASYKTIIFDRSWYSDMVYGTVMRGREEMTQEHADMLAATAAISCGGGMIIYCTAPTKVLWSRCQRRGESYIKDIDTLAAISRTYQDVMKNKVKFLHVVRCDTSVRW